MCVCVHTDGKWLCVLIYEHVIALIFLCVNCCFSWLLEFALAQNENELIWRQRSNLFKWNIVFKAVDLFCVAEQHKLVLGYNFYLIHFFRFSNSDKWLNFHSGCQKREEKGFFERLSGFHFNISPNFGPT